MIQLRSDQPLPALVDRDTCPLVTHTRVSPVTYDPRMWVDATHCDSWCGKPELAGKLDSKHDAVMHASNREGLANRFQRLVARGQHDL